jgi:serine O-acetyltransferase
VRLAVAADARVTLRYRMEPVPDGRIGLLWQIVRLVVVSDAFGAQAVYRVRARMRGLGIPVLPSLLHRVSMLWAQVCIGDPVLVEPGLYLPHGQVVIDGIVRICPDVVIAPFATIGLRAGDRRGPTVGHGAQVGTGARVLGPITVGAGARVGANAVVLNDVAPDTTVVGMPASPR